MNAHLACSHSNSISMKKILVPTDFSKNAMNAFLYAKELACKLDSHLTLLHTFQVTQRSDMLVSLDDILQKEAEKEMAAILKAAPSKTPVKAKAVKGDAVHAIADFAREGGYSLIVMGTKGERSAIEKMMGSVTTHTMMHAPCPVLAIPESAAFHSISHIAYATDFEPSDEQAVGQLMEFAGQLGSAIHFVHIDTKAIAGSVEDYVMVENYPFPFTDFSVIGSRSASDGLDEFVKKNKIDVLALFIPNRRLWERLFHTSFTKQMAFHSKVPLLVFHE